VVLVDEYQDSDPAQESLLMALAGDGRELIAVGDPDQSIYAFRGADVQGAHRVPGPVPHRGRPARPVVALRTCRRSGRDPAGRVPPGGAPAPGRAGAAPPRPGTGCWCPRRTARPARSAS
jgi:hypothetical protein